MYFLSTRDAFKFASNFHEISRTVTVPQQSRYSILYHFLMRVPFGLSRCTPASVHTAVVDARHQNLIRMLK